MNTINNITLDKGFVNLVYLLCNNSSFLHLSIGHQIVSEANQYLVENLDKYKLDVEKNFLWNISDDHLVGSNSLLHYTVRMAESFSTLALGTIMEIKQPSQEVTVNGIALRDGNSLFSITLQLTQKIAELHEVDYVLSNNDLLEANKFLNNVNELLGKVDNYKNTILFNVLCRFKGKLNEKLIMTTLSRGSNEN